MSQSETGQGRGEQSGEPTTTVEGARAEDRAALHLARLGYIIVARNARTAGGELDIIAREGEVLCFVEVRRRVIKRDALESVDGRKRARIARAAQGWLLLHPTRAPCRFDVVAVSGRAPALHVDLVRDAFRMEA